MMFLAITGISVLDLIILLYLKDGADDWELPAFAFFMAVIAVSVVFLGMPHGAGFGLMQFYLMLWLIVRVLGR